MCNFPLVLEDFIASYLLVTVIVTSCLFQSYLSLNHSQHCLFKSLSKVPVIFRKGNRTAKHIHCEHSKTKYFTIVSFKKLNNKKKDLLYSIQNDKLPSLLSLTLFHQIKCNVSSHQSLLLI